MKAERRDIERLEDIVEAASAAIRFGDRTDVELSGDELRQAALVQKITVIGEAASRVSAETRALLPDLPWREMVGMRDRVVHQYWEVATPRLWQTVQDELPILVEQLTASRDRWPRGD